MVMKHRTSPCQLACSCYRQSGTGSCLSTSTAAFPCQYQSTTAISTSIPLQLMLYSLSMWQNFPIKHSPLHCSAHTCGASTLLVQLRSWRCRRNTPNVVTIYQLSKNIPEHLNLHLVPQIRMCRVIPPFPMYFHGTQTRVPLRYQHGSVICCQHHWWSAHQNVCNSCHH